MPTDLNIMAFDPGSGVTGWCYGEAGEYQASGIFRLKKWRNRKIGRTPETIWERLDLLGDLVATKLDEYHPEVVGIEWPFGPGGNAAKIKLGMSMGVIAREVGKRHIPILEVNPQEIKDTKCSKDNLVYAGAIAKRKVRKDEADAIGCWLVLEGKLAFITVDEALDTWGSTWSTR